MTSSETFIIVGAGQAGARAAEAMRKAGFAGRVMLIGEEPEPPYERPPLSKAVLLGERPPESCRVLPADFYAANNIELITGIRAGALDAKARRVALEDGRRLAYDKLLLTTGGRVRTLRFAPLGRPGVHYLRSLADSLALRAALLPGRRLAVIGGGFLGLEVAASARKRGLEVTVLELKPNLLDRAMAPEIAAYVEALHRRNGVTLRLGVMVTDIAGKDRAEAVILGDGTRIPADLVLVSVGILPNVELAEAAGAAIDNGIVVDEYGRTSLEHVYGAGDAVNHPNPLLGHRLRLESWQNAQNQAIAVANAMCGAPKPYAEVPWFWTDQHGINIQMTGVPLATEAVATRGDPASGRFLCFNLQEGRVVGATAFNMGGEIRFARKLIESRAPVDPAALADTSRKLKDIVAAIVP